MTPARTAHRTDRWTIETERLRLVPVPVEQARRVAGGDVAVLGSGLRPGRGWPHAGTSDALRAAAADPGPLPSAWLVALRGTGEVIGELGWKGPPSPDGVAELGYGLSAAFRGQGLGTEAVGAFAAWALERPDCRRLIAEVLADNVASRRLLERIGFALDRVVPPHVWYARDGQQ